MDCILSIAAARGRAAAWRRGRRLMIPLRAIEIVGTEQSRTTAQSIPGTDEINPRIDLTLTTAAGRCAAAASAQ
jgi:hypothetical protein